MKKLIIALTLILTLGAFNVSAQNMKIGYVDYVAVIDSLPSMIKADQQLQAYQKEEKKVIEEMQIEFQNDYAEFIGAQDTLDKFIAQRKYERLAETERIIQQRQYDLEQDLMIMRDRALEDIEKRLRNAIKIVAERHKLTYVLDKSSLWYNNPETSFDITKEVREEMMKTEPNGTTAP